MQSSTAKPMAALPEDDATVQSQLQSLAEEIVSAVSELDPSYRKEVLGLFVADLFSQMTEQEHREERRQRQAEGIAAAKARGVRFGRAGMPAPENFDRLHQAWRNGEMSLQQAANACGISKGTFHGMAVRKEKAESCAG